MIRNANPATALGTPSAVLYMEVRDRGHFTAWGSTGGELEALLPGESCASPVRISDDLGMSMVELAGIDLEGRRDALPLVFVGSTGIASGKRCPKSLLPSA